MKIVFALIALIVGMYVLLSFFDIPSLSLEQQVKYRTCEILNGVPMVTSDDMVVCLNRKTNVPQ